MSYRYNGRVISDSDWGKLMGCSVIVNKAIHLRHYGYCTVKRVHNFPLIIDMFVSNEIWCTEMDKLISRDYLMSLTYCG